jgi:hypothetical protein
VTFDPCGMVCDYLRSCYADIIRPYAGSPYTEGRAWYWADPGAQILPFASVFGAIDFDPDKTDYGLPGVVYHKNPLYRFGNFDGHPPGDRYCGTEADFQGRSLFTGDHAPLNPNLTHKCCFDHVPIDCTYLEANMPSMAGNLSGVGFDLVNPGEGASYWFAFDEVNGFYLEVDCIPGGFEAFLVDLTDPSGTPYMFEGLTFNLGPPLIINAVLPSDVPTWGGSVLAIDQPFPPPP